MKKHKRSPVHQRDPTPQRRTSAGIVTDQAWHVLCADGYKPITQCAEVQMCLHKISALVASMTLHLMRNTDGGDVREINQLSRKLDIDPARHMTHQTFFHLLTYVLLSEGNQVTIPHYTADGYLQDLQPVKPSRLIFEQVGEDDYQLRANQRIYQPDEVLHFALNPDPEQPWRGMGYTVSLRDVVKSIRQANATKLALMESPAPSLIVKVDAVDEDFETVEGRERLGAQYLDASENGRPWFIPAEIFDVTQVKPLTISDLAIREHLELDKRTAAAIFGMPAFMIGVGEYKRDEYNNFVSTVIMQLARIIQQELTKKTLLSPDLYWRFNVRSLMAYDIGEIVSAGAQMVDHAAMRRNEWRDWLGITPDPDMDELLILENYLPAGRLGDQKKLNGQGGEPNEPDKDSQPGEG